MSKKFAVLFICFVVMGCTFLSGDKRPEGRVVERSKQTKPVWADAPLNQLIVNATEAKFHFAKYKERDLPIAVKLAQTAAIENSYGPWRPSFDTRLAEFPKLLAARKNKNEAEYATLVEQAARKVHAQAAQIEDIYYERIQIDDVTQVPELAGVSEYFDVHVLVQLQPVESEKLKNVIYQVFSTAKSLDLKKSVVDLAPAKKKPGKK